MISLRTQKGLHLGNRDKLKQEGGQAIGQLRK